MKLFITDWASYNNGTQFQVGKWWDLTEYPDSEDFMEAVKKHFENADETSPLECGGEREELFCSDHELPCGMGSESCLNDIEEIYAYMNLNDHEKPRVEARIEILGMSVAEAIESEDGVSLYDDNDGRGEYEIFEMFYPEQVDLSNPWVTINYDGFRKEFTEFTDEEGNDWLVETY